jgi:transposase
MPPDFGPPVHYGTIGPRKEGSMTHRRQFTAAFKAQVVLELRSGAKIRAELCREQQLASSVLADWNASFLARAALRFKSPDQRDDQDATRVAELERLNQSIRDWHSWAHRDAAPTRASGN